VIYQHTKFLDDISYDFRVLSRTTLKSKNKQRAITPELGKAELWFLCTAYIYIYIYLQSFMLILLIVLQLCPEQIFLKGKIIQKWGLTEFWFFCTAPLLNEIYLPTIFHINIAYSFKVMSRTKFKVLKLSKGNNSRIIVLMHCTYTHWDLFTFTVSCWFLL
jgi:hypothetical protein